MLIQIKSPSVGWQFTAAGPLDIDNLLNPFDYFLKMFIAICHDEFLPLIMNFTKKNAFSFVLNKALLRIIGSVHHFIIIGEETFHFRPLSV